MTSLREVKPFHLRTLITNFQCKLSAISENCSDKQILCLVSNDNEILLRYTSANGSDTLKLISWFSKCSRIIHDVCFDPSGIWLLVLCFDNTLHIVPALKLVDKNQDVATTFSLTEITSFLIPFVGPHECPNSKTCPNNELISNTSSTSPFHLLDYTFDKSETKDCNTVFKFANRVSNLPELGNTGDGQATSNLEEEVVLPSNEDDTLLKADYLKHFRDEANKIKQKALAPTESPKPFMSSSTCPFPVCSTWWRTLDKRHRAIIGYSDGSICFVGLTPNCPFISNTHIEYGAIVKLAICHDNSMENITLLVNSSTKEQWKLLLEQTSINYVFPGDGSPHSTQSDGERDDWQLVIPIKSNNTSKEESQIDEESVSKGSNDDKDESPSKSSSSGLPVKTESPQKLQDSGLGDVVPVAKSGLLPAAKARLASLKDIGSKKFAALKMKLSENKGNSSEEDSSTSFAIMESQAKTPEILTTSSGPFYTVQNLRSTYLLSALHTYSDTLSVHSMDISLMPLFLYKIPRNCQNMLITSNLLYSHQFVDKISTPENITDENVQEMVGKDTQGENDNEKDSEKKLTNAVGVLSSAMAAMKNGEEIEFNEQSLLALFEFPDEVIVNIHQMTTFPEKESPTQKDESADEGQTTEIRSPSTYVRLHKKFESEEFNYQRSSQVMQQDFPKFNYDPCIVVTNQNTYLIEFSNKPHSIFLNAAISGMWNVCEEFCNTFDLSFTHCVEFAGDCLLRRKKVTQALLTYNVVRLPPVRTALKLAMFGENYALMHLCAMALKMTYVLKSKFFAHPQLSYLLETAEYRHAEQILGMPNDGNNTQVNEGEACSDYKYGVDEASTSLQLSAASQFHLSNLLIITLSERAVKEKHYLPVWNFLVTNTKYHANMTSIVLAQSGLYSSALLLAIMRGASFDVFTALVGVASQEFGWYSELNVLLYNLSEEFFSECVTYLRPVSCDYLNFLQIQMEKIEERNLQRLKIQLNPFSPVFRPFISYLSSRAFDSTNQELFNFTKLLIETYLGIIMQLETLKKRPENIFSALDGFRLNYEDNQFAIKSSNFLPISAGCSHCACIVDGVAYFWGSNGLPAVYSSLKLSDNQDPPHTVKRLDLIAQLNLFVHAVKCGRQHSLLLTNNGVYAFGSNQLGQLGIGKHTLLTQQPMLVKGLDNKNITVLEAGQYHNAAVADGILYTWGWGVYGQLGHGDIENCPQPRRVEFFSGKEVIQVSLGHSHSLVLCNTGNSTELYVFGSNHFGQLGIGQISMTGEKSSSLIKCLLPIKLSFTQGNLRLIHTKFFTNLAVTENDEMFTWGASPQALRLANQIRRRSNAKQKIEESLKKELDRRIELSNEVVAPLNAQNVSSDNRVQTAQNNSIHKSSSATLLCNEKAGFLSELATGLKRRNSEPKENLTKLDQPALNWVKSENMAPVINNKIKLTKEETSLNEKNMNELNTNKPDHNISIIIENVDNAVDKQEITENDNLNNVKEPVPPMEYPGDHLFPLLVDTSELAGQILQVSTGLFHFAVITSTSVLYTWGKNLEHQLGTEDRDRRSVNRPKALESVEDPLHVECGADFTIVMTRDYVVKAFGGNANGQCGRALGKTSDKSKLPGKFFCLPTSKRIMRLDGQCIESPVVINLPRPTIDMNYEPTRYFKSFPKFKTAFIVKSSINHSTMQNRNFLDYCQEADDLASSIENISLNDEDSLYSGDFHQKPGGGGCSSCDISTDDENHHRTNKKRATSQTSIDNNNDIVASADINHFRQYIHYCLFIFHGLYDSDKICDFAYNNIEFRIRARMLNYKYVDAFSLCLTKCHNAQISIRVFEYFTKDRSIVPMQRQDLKTFIHRLLLHFLLQNFDIAECEKFFLGNLDYYLLELCFILYFNNNNTELEQNINHKFKNFFAQNISDSSWDLKYEDTTPIFNLLSVKFKTIICQRLMKICEG